MDVERRSLLRGLAVGLTGVAVTPTPSGAHAHASATSLSDAQPAAPPTIPSPTPSALDAHQRATLESLAELILPGAVTAGAVERIDRVAAVDAPAAQRRLQNAIARFDQEARETAGARWLDRGCHGAATPAGLDARTAGRVADRRLGAAHYPARSPRSAEGGHRRRVCLDRSRDDRARMDRALVLARAARLHA